MIEEISMPSNTEAWRNLLLTGAGHPSEPHLSLVRSYARSTRGRQTMLSLLCRRHEHMHDMELLHVVLAQHRSVASKAIDTIADAACPARRRYQILARLQRGREHGPRWQ